VSGTWNSTAVLLKAGTSIAPMARSSSYPPMLRTRR
jgi:hypothetical protein